MSVGTVSQWICLGFD